MMQGNRGVKQQRHVLQDMLWGQARIASEDHSFVSGLKRIYVGHTSVPLVKQLGNIFYMDTGAGQMGGALSIMNMNKDEIFYCAIDEQLVVQRYDYTNGSYNGT